MKEFMQQKVRPIAISIAAPVFGFLLVLLIEIFLDVEVPKLFAAIINLVVVGLIAFILVPRILGIPFGKMETVPYLRRLGFYLPPNSWKHIGLGILLAFCTLSAMLVASLITGQYMPDLSTINLPQVVFSLNPGLWEELFYRGILMIVLLQLTGSLKKAAGFQIIIFGLAHIKGVGLWDWVDVLTVMVLAIGFTYVAYKTGALVAGIVFHFLHDALLFFVQLPSNAVTSTVDNLIFFGLLWVMVGVACLLTKILTERFNIQAEPGLYQVS
jgi:membrane protease YdiL (CAAX protease family)